jgi:hypothetical protein
MALNAIEHHYLGWAEIDETLVVDEATQQLFDFLASAMTSVV